MPEEVVSLSYTAQHPECTALHRPQATSVRKEVVLLSLPASLGSGQERQWHWGEGLLGDYVREPLSPCSANITSG